MSTKNTNLIIEEENKGNFDRDLKNSIDTAKDEGYLEGEQVGLQKGKQIGEEIGMQKGQEIGKISTTMEVAKKAKLLGLDTQTISQMTGLSTGEIEKL